MIVRYINLTGKNLKYIILGLLSALIASYNNVYVNHYTSIIIQGNFANENLYNLYISSILTIIFTSIRGSLFAYSQKFMNSKLK